LVDLRKEKWTYPLFITISPNPKVKHQVYRGSKKVKLPYSNLTHDEQYNYCLDILKKIYISPDTQIFGSWELKLIETCPFSFNIYRSVSKESSNIGFL